MGRRTDDAEDGAVLCCSHRSSRAARAALLTSGCMQTVWSEVGSRWWSDWAQWLVSLCRQTAALLRGAVWFGGLKMTGLSQTTTSTLSLLHTVSTQPNVSRTARAAILRTALPWTPLPCSHQLVLLLILYLSCKSCDRPTPASFACLRYDAPCWDVGGERTSGVRKATHFPLPTLSLCSSMRWWMSPSTTASVNAAGRGTETTRWGWMDGREWCPPCLLPQSTHSSLQPSILFSHPLHLLILPRQLA